MKKPCFYERFRGEIKFKFTLKFKCKCKFKFKFKFIFTLNLNLNSKRRTPAMKNEQNSQLVFMPV